MAQEIILFLSERKENAKSFSYVCPDGSHVTGTQTNEAPVKYLLNRYPNTKKIICIVTERAKDTAWEPFQTEVGAITPGIEMEMIPFEEGQDFSKEPLNSILQMVKPEDEVLLETTGGFRNAIMHLLLLSRVLSYTGVRTVCAVYSNFNEKRIEDVSHLIEMFELVGGMQELTSLGSAATLKRYYENQPRDERIAELLNAMETLTETITLCRTRQIEGCMDRFLNALENAKDCNDPLMKQLLPAFRAKFGKKLNVAALIKWCVKSDMIQQALTVYTERIPAFIINRGDIMTVPDISFPGKEYEDPQALKFLRGFLRLSTQSADASIQKNPAKAFKAFVKHNIKDIASWSYSGKVPKNVPSEMQTGLQNLILLARLAYVENGGVFRHDWASQLPPEKKFLKALTEKLNDNPAQTVDKMLNDVQTYKEEYLWLLMEETPPADTDSVNDYVLTLQNLDRLLPGSGYELKFPQDQVETIARDYLYIKALRNMTNHANDESTSDQKSLMSYLSQYGYKALEDVRAEDVKQAILTGLDHLRPRSKKGSRTS